MFLARIALFHFHKKTAPASFMIIQKWSTKPIRFEMRDPEKYLPQPPMIVERNEKIVLWIVHDLRSSSDIYEKVDGTWLHRYLQRVRRPPKRFQMHALSWSRNDDLPLEKVTLTLLVRRQWCIDMLEKTFPLKTLGSRGEVRIPCHAKVFHSMLVLRWRLNEQGFVPKHKVQLLVCGDEDDKSDLKSISLPRWTHYYQNFYGISPSRNVSKIHHYNFQNTFQNRDPERPVLVQFPGQMFDDERGRDCAMDLRKSLYRFECSLKIWHGAIEKKFIKSDNKVNKTSLRIFKKKDLLVMSFLIEQLVTVKTKENITQSKDDLGFNLNLKDLGKHVLVLCLGSTRFNDGVLLDREMINGKLLTESDTDEPKAVKSAIAFCVEYFYGNDEFQKGDNRWIDQRVISKQWYLASKTQPDMCVAASSLGPSLWKLLVCDRTEAERILRFSRRIWKILDGDKNRTEW